MAKEVQGMTNNKARAAPGKVKRTVAAAFAAAVRRGDIYMRCPRCKRGVNLDTAARLPLRTPTTPT
jgi:hypothetical protein